MFSFLCNNFLGNSSCAERMLNAIYNRDVELPDGEADVPGKLIRFY